MSTPVNEAVAIPFTLWNFINAFRFVRSNRDQTDPIWHIARMRDHKTAEFVKGETTPFLRRTYHIPVKSAQDGIELYQNQWVLMFRRPIPR